MLLPPCTGVDSLGAMELRSSLTNSIGCTLPTTLLYDHQSSAEIAAFISQSLEEQEVNFPIQDLIDAVITPLLCNDLHYQ